MLVDRLWASQPGTYFCISTKSASKKWEDHFFSRADFKRLPDFLEKHRDKDIYFCPHGFEKQRRLEKYAVMPTLLWADMDECDPRECKIKPTIAIESSPGRYVGLWTIDKRLPRKEVNQALTYHIGADRGGWDLTQVLRVPGTRNFKYRSTPSVRVLWSDGPAYALKDIERKLPKLREDEDTPTTSRDAVALYEKHEKSLPSWCRRELLNGKPTQGKRSEMIWKLTNTLMEIGLSSDEAFVLLKASPWNKFKGRDEQLRREIAKCKGRKLSRAEKEDSKEDRGDYQFLSRPIADVEEEELDWLWYPYLARGELSILEGDPGLGKSYLAQIVSGHIVDGRRLPSVKRFPIAQGTVAYFDIENSVATVTKKRLTTNGVENLKDFYQEEEPFSVDDEDALERVSDAVERLQPLVVVFDTLNTYIGKADIYKSSETQQAFAKFKMIAKRFNCAVLVLRHLTKGSKERALYRGQGSIAFSGLARVVMTVGVLPDDEDTRVMAVTKLNVTRKPKALTFTITELPDKLKERDRSKFDWGDFIEITSDEILASPTPNKDGSSRDDAKGFLKTLLSEPMPASKVESVAEGKSFNWRTVQRAADELGVIRKLVGFGQNKKSIWSLPKEKAAGK